MKTAVSLPDPLFKKAEAAARKLKMSRSQFYATAIAEYLERQKAKALTAELNEVYSRIDTALDPALEQAQLEVLKRERW